MADSTSDFPLRPVAFSRLSRRGILLGLSLPQLLSGGFAAIVIVTSLYAGGSNALLYSAPLWLVSAVATWAPVAGRRAIEWAPVAITWATRSARGQTRYRKRVLTPRPSGTLALPGDAAPLRQYVDPETGAVMIHDPYAATLTAVVEVSHPSFVLLDPGEQERRVNAWGRVLATACRSPRIARLQVLERTLPDSGTGLQQWWAAHGTDDGSWVATNYRELIERAGPAGERHISTVSLALDLRASSREVRAAGGGMKGAAHILRQEMSTLSAALRTAELRTTGWYGPHDLAIALRSAYDPAIAASLERSSGVGQDLEGAGPVAVHESWDRLRTDSAFHAVYWISEWPRSQVYPGFLSPLLLNSGVRRSISLIYNPIRADVAARTIRKRKTEQLSDRAQRARIGQVEDAAFTAELRDVLQQEADLTTGHGVLRYAGLVSVSAPTGEELDSACATIEQAAIQSSCETRRLVLQQAQAFTAAALPLCRGI
jgi:hypothetical protein